MGRVAAVTRDAGHGLDVLAREGVAPATARAIAARAAEPAYPGTVADLPTRDIVADGGDCTDHLVPRHARILDAGYMPSNRQRIAVADPASMNLN